MRAGLAAAALALVACASGAAAAPSRSANAAGPVWHRYAACVRDHGQPGFPDPTVDAQGHALLPDGVHVSPDAAQACASVLDALPASARVQKGMDVAQMRQFARCMREQGVEDWPDPDDMGVFHLPDTLGRDLKSSPRWPEIRAAWQGPCLRYDPTGQLGFAAK